MANNENLIPIPGRLHSVATEGHVAGADEIFDDTLNKDQATLNSESAYIDDSESSSAVIPEFDPESQTVHVTAQILSEQQKAQVRTNIGLGDVDAKINEAVASEASQRAATDSSLQSSINAEVSRAKAAEQLLQEQYNALTQSDIIVGALPASGTKNKIYRVPGTNTYSDYMWNGSSFVKMATYDNATDDEPTAVSENLVKSEGLLSDTRVIRFVGKGAAYYEGVLHGEAEVFILDNLIIGHKYALLFDSTFIFTNDWPTTSKFGIQKIVNGETIEVVYYNKADLFDFSYFVAESNEYKFFCRADIGQNCTFRLIDVTYDSIGMHNRTIFNESRYFKPGYGIGDDGNIQARENRSVFDLFLPAEERAVLTIISSLSANIACYDANKSYLGWVSGNIESAWALQGSNEIKLLSGTKYVKIAYNANTSFSDAMSNVLIETGLPGFGQSVNLDEVTEITTPKSYSQNLYNNSIQVNDGFRDVSTSDCTMALDDKYGIVCYIYTGSETSYGEQHDYVSLAYFPIGQVFKAKNIKVGQGITYNNIISLGNGVFRILYVKVSNNVATYYYKDFNCRTESFGEEIEMKMTDYAGDIVSVNNVNRNQYLVDSLGSLPSGSEGTVVYIVSKLKKYNNKWYGIITGNYDYGLIFSSSDNMENLSILGIFDRFINFEADLCIKNNIIHIIYRLPSNIAYCYASFESDVIGSYSQQQIFSDSTGSRARIFEYKDTINVMYTSPNIFNCDFPQIYNNRNGLKIRQYSSENGIGNVSVLNNILYETSTEHGIVYPDYIVNYDDIYIGFSSSICGLQVKNTASQVDEAKECMMFGKAILL